jgi:hypothetical protein
LLVLLAPTLATAASQTGSTYGVNGGYVQAGLWDTYTFDHVGGAATIQLTWAAGSVPCGADYDLWLYPPGALDDGKLTEQPIATSESHNCGAPKSEAISILLPSAKYVIAVVPWQAEGEVYHLTTNNGWLNPAALTVGTQVECPTIPCLL